jgi:hypothetical protein
MCTSEWFISKFKGERTVGQENCEHHNQYFQGKKG